MREYVAVHRGNQPLRQRDGVVAVQIAQLHDTLHVFFSDTGRVQDAVETLLQLSPLDEAVSIQVELDEELSLVHCLLLANELVDHQAENELLHLGWQRHVAEVRHEAEAALSSELLNVCLEHALQPRILNGLLG